jgi:hypothetical protein
MNFCKFNKNLIACATVHNNTLKLLEFNGGCPKEIFSYENLPGKLMSVDTIKGQSCVYFSGDQISGEINLDIKRH